MPKHFPFPWFESVLNSGDCNSAHIANLFDPTNGLYHDLQSESTTPAFSWITPNNCSDAHDAVCHGNNLSGGFSDPNTPNAPVNYTGGLYAADLFLEHVVPEIEASPAFKDGGLIDITFDEAFPPFTYSGNSFANSTIDAPERGDLDRRPTRPAEKLFGRNVHCEPTGPEHAAGDECGRRRAYPGPGDNAYIDRPGNCVAQTVPAQAAGTCLLGGGATRPAPALTPAHRGPGSATIDDNSISRDRRRAAHVTGTGIPAGAFVGQGHRHARSRPRPGQAGGIADTGSFTLATASGDPLARRRRSPGSSSAQRPPAPTRCSTPPTPRTAAATPAAC